MTVIELDLQVVSREALLELDEFQQFLRWRETHSCLPARLPCDCGTPTVLRASGGHVQCARCGHEQRKRMIAQIGQPDKPYAMHSIVARAFAAEHQPEVFISAKEIREAFQKDVRRRYEEGRARYDDYRALHPHRPKDDCGEPKA